MNAENRDEDHVKHAANLVPQVLGITIGCDEVREEIEEQAHFVEYKNGLKKILNVLGPRHRCNNRLGRLLLRLQLNLHAVQSNQLTPCQHHREATVYRNATNDMCDKSNCCSFLLDVEACKPNEQADAVLVCE